MSITKLIMTKYWGTGLSLPLTKKSQHPVTEYLSVFIPSSSAFLKNKHAEMA